MKFTARKISWLAGAGLVAATYIGTHYIPRALPVSLADTQAVATDQAKIQAWQSRPVATRPAVVAPPVPPPPVVPVQPAPAPTPTPAAIPPPAAAPTPTAPPAPAPAPVAAARPPVQVPAKPRVPAPTPGVNARYHTTAPVLIQAPATQPPRPAPVDHQADQQKQQVGNWFNRLEKQIPPPASSY